jgi:putative selenium metabolism protein SsnA
MLLIGNGLVITRDEDNTIIEDGCVAVEENTILDIGMTSDLRSKYKDAKFLDAENKLIMPGLINTHMHFYSTFARGMSLKDTPPIDFIEILKKLWWRLDKALTLEDVYYSAMIPILDCIKNGVTTVFDHHASPNAVTGSLFQIAKATKQAGLRSCLCYEVSDRDGEKIAQEGIEENLNYIEYCKNTKDPMQKAMFGLHASFTLSDRTLEKCVDRNSGNEVGFHIHAAEGMEDQLDSIDRYKMGVIERLQQRNVLGNRSFAVHCVHITDKERKLLTETQTNVIHNPESNMANAVGIAPILSMFQQGVMLGMGTDGYTSDMFESFKAANCSQKYVNSNPSVAWGEVPTILFHNNVDIARKYFEQPIGKLVPGAYADIIVVDYQPPTRINSDNLDSHILFGVNGRSVDTTIINGQIVMEHRKLKLTDEQEIYRKSRELADKVWERF